jgi:hypothetical protein
MCESKLKEKRGGHQPLAYMNNPDKFGGQIGGHAELAAIHFYFYIYNKVASTPKR